MSAYHLDAFLQKKKAHAEKSYARNYPEEIEFVAQIKFVSAVSRCREVPIRTAIYAS